MPQASTKLCYQVLLFLVLCDTQFVVTQWCFVTELLNGGGCESSEFAEGRFCVEQGFRWTVSRVFGAEWVHSYIPNGCAQAYVNETLTQACLSLWWWIEGLWSPSMLSFSLGPPIVFQALPWSFNACTVVFQCPTDRPVISTSPFFMLASFCKESSDCCTFLHHCDMFSMNTLTEWHAIMLLLVLKS